jgi:hypothetical protein
VQFSEGQCGLEAASNSLIAHASGEAQAVVTARPFCTQHYGTSKRIAEVQAIATKIFLARPAHKASKALPITVIGDRVPICRKAGLSVDEIRLASEAAHLIEGLGLRLWYAVVSDQYADERAIRSRIRDFKSDLARAQRRSGLPACCWLEILEGRPAVHSNILFPLDGPKAQRLIEGLLRSSKFPGDELHIAEAEGADWFVAYCSAERVTQARYVGVGRLAKRLPGSHPLGMGGGDRVRVSKALEAELLDRGVRPWSHTYASRSLPPSSGISTNVDRQSLFDELPSASASAKGRGATKARARPPLPIPTLPLAMAPTVADMLGLLGPTHAAIAQRVGVSRPQVTNIINGRFGAGRDLARRVLELARAA